jgi:CubicO group peptidase (beta-lactamase class C family)
MRNHCLDNECSANLPIASEDIGYGPDKLPWRRLVFGLLSEETAPTSSLSLPLSTFAALARKHRVPGAQLAIHHDGATVVGEVGELEFRTGRRVAGDAAFPVGSITKCFTATVAMILAADGDVDPDAPIGDYVPELGDLGLRINLRQLLSHTSGLADISSMEDLSTLTLRRYVADHVRRNNLVLPPGAGFSYSNPGYAVAGRLIETVTGMSWAEAVESILLRPLEIEAAFVDLPGARSARRPFAAGHSANIATGRIRPVGQSGGAAIAPAGGLALSAEDLIKLGLIHVGPGAPKLLPAAYANQMREPVPCADPFGLADGWGLGLALYRQEAADWVGHDGNADGTSCYLRINPADGWVIALTSNANTGAFLWQDLLAELARANVPIDAPRAPALRGPLVVPPADCVGRYVNGDAEYSVTLGSHGSIRISVDGGNFPSLTLHEDLTVSMLDPGSGRRMLGGRFAREPATGRVYGIQVGGRLARKQVFPGRALSAAERLAPTG